MGLEELRSAPFASTPIDEHAAKTKTKQGPEEGRSQHGAGETPPVPRDKRTAVYAMAKVQKASRKYMRGTSRGIVSRMRHKVPDGSVPGVNQRKL